jgi:hypothetical protein
VKWPLYIRAGETFGRLTALEDAPKSRMHITFRCECGREKHLNAGQIKVGVVKSCGCLKDEAFKRCQAIGVAMSSGHSKHPLYQTWRGIIARTSDPQHTHYAWYGGRGITVHEPWRDPKTFYADIAASIGPRPEGHTLDRINNDGNYEPGNVRWATPGMQVRNQRPRKRNPQGKRKHNYTAVVRFIASWNPVSSPDETGALTSR